MSVYAAVPAVSLWEAAFRVLLAAAPLATYLEVLTFLQNFRVGSKLDSSR
jgi:hypothetical protein